MFRLLPYVSAYFDSGMNLRATEFMQYRFPVGLGPSSKRCPRWASHREQCTSVLVMPQEVSFVMPMGASGAISQKLGHPDPEENFSSEVKRMAPQPMQASDGS